MPSTNEQIADLLIRHQVGVFRMSTSVLKKLIPILNKADAEIVDKLLARSATLEGSFTSTRLTSLLDALRNINRDAVNELGKRLRGELVDVAKYEAEFTSSMLTQALPIKWDIVTPSAETLKAVVTARPFQGKLLKDWLSELDAGRSRRVRDAVRLGMVQGETTPQIVRRIMGTKALGYKDGVMEISRRGAEAMVRTAVAHTASAARDELYQENADLIAQEQWVATLDTRTCPICGGLDGKKFDLGQGERPPIHISCRCVRIAITKSWKELGFNIDELPPGTRASMNGQVPASMTYNEWLKKQHADVQDDALGPTRGKLFRDGGLDVQSFTNRANDELTLDELRAKDADAFKKAGLAT
jgi:SPP1 gp7 family putative phage head morphogenesis protein